MKNDNFQLILLFILIWKIYFGDAKGVCECTCTNQGSTILHRIANGGNQKPMNRMRTDENAEQILQDEPQVFETNVHSQMAVVAHMTNSKNAVKWSLDVGATGVELDLKFNSDGSPSKFHHGGSCDCSCICPWYVRLEMMRYLGSDGIREKLAIIYIDAKFESIKNLYSAGEKVVNMLNENIFQNGYAGQVIIGCYDVTKSDYLRGAMDAALNSPYGDSYFYSFDGLSDFHQAWQLSLTLGTKNIVYSTGISTCVHDLHDFKHQIKGSVAKNGYAGIGVWSIDGEGWTSTSHYMDAGITFLLTNYPQVAVEFIGGDRLARPGKALVAISGNLTFMKLEDVQFPTTPLSNRNAEGFAGYSGEIKY